MERFCDMRDNVWIDDSMKVMLCMRWGRDIVERVVMRGLLCMKELKGIQRLLTVLFALYGSILSPPLHHRYT